MSPALLPSRQLLAYAFPEGLWLFWRESQLWAFLIVFPLVLSLCLRPALPWWAILAMMGLFFPALAHGKQSLVALGMGLVLLTVLLAIPLLLAFSTPIQGRQWELLVALPGGLQAMAIGKLFYLWFQAWERALENFAALPWTEQRGVLAPFEASRTSRRLDKILSPTRSSSSPRKRI
jgi:hypothetical protein